METTRGETGAESPPRVQVPRDVVRPGAVDRESGTPVAELRPASGVRVVGPGRVERAYREEIGSLEREVETLGLLQRGAERRQDRLEAELERSRRSLEEERQVERRLLVAIGALQKENEALRRRVEAISAPARPALAGRRRTRRRGLLARLLGRG